MKKLLKRAGIIFVFAFMALVVYRGIFYALPKEFTDKQVEKIHATRLSLVDVMGKNLPPTPQNPDATVAGVDGNENGIRDDVELAIFKEYPDSAKTRAVLLQYALALQMEVTQKIVNEGTVIAVAQDSGRAYQCVGEIVSRDNFDTFIAITEGFHSFVEERQWNTPARMAAHKEFYRGNLGSYSSLKETCDLDLNVLPN